LTVRDSDFLFFLNLRDSDLSNNDSSKYAISPRKIVTWVLSRKQNGGGSHGVPRVQHFSPSPNILCPFQIVSYFKWENYFLFRWNVHHLMIYNLLQLQIYTSSISIYMQSLRPLNLSTFQRTSSILNYKDVFVFKYFLEKKTKTSII
jgi:hypothetical protein